MARDHELAGAAASAAGSSGGTSVSAPLASASGRTDARSEATTARSHAIASRTLKGEVSPRPAVNGAATTSMAAKQAGTRA